MTSALISLVGLGDSIYLTIQHLTGRSVRCAIVSGCSVVLSSRYATIGGFPTATLGAVAYFTVFSCAILALYGYNWAERILSLTVALMTVTTLGLLYLQAFVLHSFCTYCLISAASTILLAVMSLAGQRKE